MYVDAGIWYVCTVLRIDWGSNVVSVRVRYLYVVLRAEVGNTVFRNIPVVGIARMFCCPAVSTGINTFREDDFVLRINVVTALVGLAR